MSVVGIRIVHSPNSNPRRYEGNKWKPHESMNWKLLTVKQRKQKYGAIACYCYVDLNARQVRHCTSWCVWLFASPLHSCSLRRFCMEDLWQMVLLLSTLRCGLNVALVAACHSSMCHVSYDLKIWSHIVSISYALVICLWKANSRQATLTEALLRPPAESSKDLEDGRKRWGSEVACFESTASRDTSGI